MKKIYGYLLMLLVSLSSCETVIHPVLPAAEPVVVVDAWINNVPGKQIIRVNKTLPYFDASPQPGISGARVSISGSDGSYYSFEETDSSGVYIWTPDSAGGAFGKTGTVYELTVNIGPDHYYATSQLFPVPPIDSINFTFSQGNQFMPDSYTAQFFSTDLKGFGNTYWIKAYKNGVFLSKPSEINIAFDAGFSQGSIVDGIQFIQPIREGINPFEQDSNGNLLPSYLPGDSVYVELNSITNDAFNFLSQVSTQTNRPGGFSELFAQPLANVPTNIQSENPGKTVIGFFNVSSVSSLGKRLVIKKD